jgi:serine/threonine-protein kinase
MHRREAYNRLPMTPDEHPTPPDSQPSSPLADTVAATPVTTGRPTTPAIPRTGPEPQVREAPSLEPAGRRYTGGRSLGEGGMGDVRLCHDDLLDRDVARKKMRRELAIRADLLRRFVREARVQGRLEHPSIVPMYDMDVESGAPFFTMKRVQGSTLSQVLERLRAGDPTARDAYSTSKLLSAFASVCLTMDLAHANGVVHRDLKPDNIMLGSYGELYVLDWGIAKIGEEFDDRPRGAPEGVLASTKTGACLGTPGYMAPEQLDEDGDVDARADVYALGAILFEIITLEPLMPVADLRQMIQAAQIGVEPRPSVRAPGCQAPPELDEICERATARDKGDRYASVRELYEAIERFREKDQDLVRRRRSAEEHALAAQAAASEAETETDPEAPRRTVALREASLALALDPTHRRASDIVGALLANPPQALPREVVGELVAETKRVYRVGALGGTALLLGWFAYLPLAIALGVRSWGLYAAVSALFVVAGLGSYLASRNPPADGRSSLPLQLCLAAPIAALSMIWTPLVLVAPVAMVFVAGMILVARTRVWPVRESAVGAAIVVVPVALSAAGLAPQFLAFRDGAMRLLPILVEMPARLTLVVSTLTLVTVTVSIFLWTVHLRNRLSGAERTLRVTAWHLRQLVARDPGVSPSAPPPPLPERTTRADLVVTIVDTAAGRVRLDDPLQEAAGAGSRYGPLSDASTPGESGVSVCEDRRVGRSVAMKRVAPGAGEAERVRFVREAKIRARLQHPAIPPLYDFRVDAAGAAYFTMRRARGRTLADTIVGGALSLHRLAEAFATTCQAVEYAHANGVAHRALSPDTVVLGDYGEVYVTDWASASTIDVADSELVRADVRALGRILASILASAQQALADTSKRSVLLGESGYVPPELEAIGARAAGFASAGDLHAAVARFLEGERDVAQRRARAVVHAALAEQAAARAFEAEGPGTADRGAAMRSVSQALALDPSNAKAVRVLMDLLTAPPRALPAEAEREIASVGREEQRRSARSAALLYLTWFLYAPLLRFPGGASAFVIGVFSVVFAAAAASFWRVARRPPEIDREELATVVCSMFAAAVLGTVAGPLVLVPTIAIGNTIGFVLQLRQKRRIFVVALACLSFTAPLLLQGLGLLAPSYVQDGDGLVVTPTLVHYTPATPIVLTFVQSMVVVSASIFFRRFRDARNRADEQIQLYAWQLRKLVPVGDSAGGQGAAS